MKNKIEKVKKFVRCIILCTTVFVIFFTGEYKSEEKFNWFYDNKTNVIQITNKTNQEILIEMKMYVGEIESIMCLWIPKQETAEINLYEEFSKEVMAEEINVYELNICNTKRGIHIMTFVFLLLGFVIGYTTKR